MSVRVSVRRPRPACATPAAVAALTVAALLGAGCAARGAGGSREGPHADGVASATLDTLSVRLADAEVRRLAARATFFDQAPEVRDADAQVAALRAQLRELAPGAAAEQVATRRVLHALAGRQAGLAVERRQLLVRFAPTEPGVRRIREEEELVARRRTELAAALAGRSEPAGER